MRRLLPFLIACAILCPPIEACAGAAAPTSFATELPRLHDGAHMRIGVVGDLQRTAPLLEVWREQNDAERARVVDEIATLHPDLLVITGDCVFDGASDAQWEAFDRLTIPWREAAIPVVSAFGNHEYWLGRTGAEKHVFERFPLNERRHWFSLALGPLRIVVLDSNDDALGAAAWSSEIAWFEKTLEAFDADPEVRGVLVTFHHPPFTNSTVTSDEPHVKQSLLPPFAHAKKTLAMLNGHVHSYERFVRDAKTYVVSGGGGGPRVKLARGDARRHPDDRYDGPALRSFNFTIYTLTTTGIAAEVHGLADAKSPWTIMDRFDLPWL